MTTGPVIGATLFAVLIAVLFVDGVVWLMGGETFTQYLIKLQAKHRGCAWALLAVIVGGAAWMVLHFEIGRFL